MRLIQILPLLSLFVAANARAQDHVEGTLRMLNDNGAWSWFEDERAIIDPLRGRLLVGSCASSSGVGGASRNGDIDVAWLDLSAGNFGYFELHNQLQADDHDTPALLVRPDGRYLALYGKHGNDPLTRYRIANTPGDAASWSPSVTYQHGAGLTYSNVYRLSESGRTYNFCRALNYDPNLMYSDDDGTTWTGGAKLLTEGGSGDRPYLRYTSDGVRRVHLIATNRHPRNYDNSIYHGYLQDDKLHNSYGIVVDSNSLDGSAPPPSALTTVFATGTVVNGTVMRRGWTIDVAADAGSNVRTLFQMRANNSNLDHRLFFGRFDGTAWTTHEVCRLGGYLYAAEDDYTGLAALHRERTDTIFVSTKIDPTTNATLPHFEIFRGVTPDQGATWAWTAITSDSSVDNLRPIVPAWDADRTALLWFRGTYTTYTNWNSAVVAWIDAPEVAIGALTYVDATTSNTTLANGLPANPSGPTTGMGPTDSNWHRRLGFGNGGEVWTSSEPSAEDAPMLRTRVAGLTQQTHDVFVVFWSNPNDDWRVRAGLASNDLRNYEKRGAASVDVSRFVTAPVITGSTVRAYYAWLGRATPNANGELDVYVDDFADGSLGSRSWYDGIAVAPVAGAAASLKVGQACNGTLDPYLSAAPQLGSTVQMGATGGTMNAFAAAQFGSGDLMPIALTVLGLPECTLLVNSPTSISFGLVNAAGHSPTIPFTVPNLTVFNGQRFAMQPWTWLPTGLEFGPALVIMPGL